VIGIVIDDHGTVTRMEVLAAQLKRPEAMVKVVGREGVNRLKAHFRERQKTPNRLGGTRQNFWRQIAQSVSQPQLADAGTSVRITVADPRFAQKVFGGVIRAKKADALTLPVSKDAYGKTASTLEQEKGIHLFVIASKGQGQGTGLLAAADGNGNITVHYLLKKSVNQQADPNALPERGAFLAALVARAEAYTARITAEAQGQKPGGAEA
jgi:hypothetical protein